MQPVLRWLIQLGLMLASYIPLAAVWAAIDLYIEPWIEQRPTDAQFDWLVGTWGTFVVGAVIYLRFVRMRIDPWIKQRLPILRRGDPEDRSGG